MDADNPDNAIKAFTELSNNVPAIGFFSRNKRIRAYIAVTNQTQRMIDSEQISQAEALFVLSLLVRKHLDFQKASMMVALNLPSLGSAPFKPIGFQYANEMRVNLKLSPVDGETSVEAWESHRLLLWITHHTGSHMARLRKIAQLGDPVLRQPAEVAIIDSQATQSIIDDMLATLADSNGVGLAAPQIYEPLRLVIIASRATPRYPEAPTMEPVVMLNPAYHALSEETEKGWEGCLSIPGIRAMVPRYKHIEVTYTDLQGTVINQCFDEFVARIFQHEYDHLNGLVYLDRVENNQDIISETEYFKRINRWILINTLEETRITCPYCGELIDILIDCSSGSQQYYEDCSVCCAPILFSLTVDALGELALLDVKRDDE